MSPPHQSDLREEDFINALAEFDSYVDVSVEELMQIQQRARKHSRLRQIEQTRIHDIMTRELATVRPDTLLREAAARLLELRISGLPVVDEAYRPIGIVTEADFLCALGIPCHHPAHSLWQTIDTMFRHPAHIGAIPETVADIMVKQLITIEDHQTLHEGIAQMKKHHIKRLVVVNTEGKLCGMVTRSNLVSVLLQQIF